MDILYSCIKYVVLPKIIYRPLFERSIPMKKKPTERLLPSTPDNAKHKSRQVKKKSGDTSKNDHPDK
jgi:hypothetical protein